MVVFSNIYNHWIRDEFLHFENVIYDFFDPRGFDGVVVTAEASPDISIIHCLWSLHKIWGGLLITGLLCSPQLKFTERYCNKDTDTIDFVFGIGDYVYMSENVSITFFFIVRL